ncbi:TPA: hypothetical protein ACGA9G_001970 [Escherichia coli]
MAAIIVMPVLYLENHS